MGAYVAKLALMASHVKLDLFGKVLITFYLHKRL